MAYVCDVSSCQKLYRACSETLLDGIKKSSSHYKVLSPFLNARERSLSHTEHFPLKRFMIYIAKLEKPVQMSRILNRLFKTTSPSPSEIYIYIYIFWFRYCCDIDDLRQGSRDCKTINNIVDLYVHEVLKRVKRGHTPSRLHAKISLNLISFSAVLDRCHFSYSQLISKRKRKTKRSRNFCQM